MLLNGFRALANRKLKILVVDDEFRTRQMLNTYLVATGYQVVTATNGEQALQVFSQETPDLVVTEVTTPKLDGYGVCRALRQSSDVPIILLTALEKIPDRVLELDPRHPTLILTDRGNGYRLAALKVPPSSQPVNQWD